MERAPFPEISRPSPHFGPASHRRIDRCLRGLPLGGWLRRLVPAGHERRGVCFHHSVLSFEQTIAHMLNPASEVSYHVLIAPDGTRARLVPEDRVAWHAGASVFHGRTGCNAFLLGVAFAGDTYATPLTDAQIASALEWLAPRRLAHGWTEADLTDHRQISPGRKDDLNPVEWQRLHAAITARFS